MSLPPVPNQSPAYLRDHSEKDIQALYEYLARLVAAMEARLQALGG